MTQQLYEQTMDAQEGVVYLLLEEMAQQRIKEYLLAYALLLVKGARHPKHDEQFIVAQLSADSPNSHAM